MYFFFCLRVDITDCPGSGGAPGIPGIPGGGGGAPGIPGPGGGGGIPEGVGGHLVTNLKGIQQVKVLLNRHIWREGLILVVRKLYPQKYWHTC